MSVDLLGRKFALSRIPQAASGATPAYQNPTAAASGAFVDLLVSDNNIAGYTVQTQDNKGFSTGSDFASEQYTVTHDVTATKEMRCDSEMMGRMHLGTFGQITTTQPDATNVAAAYKHVSTPVDPLTTRQLPAYSFLEYLGAVHDVLYPSCIFERMNLRGDSLDRINLSVTLRGSGKRTKPSGITFASTDVTKRTALKYWKNSAARISLSDPSTQLNSYNPGCDMLGWELDYNNNPLADDGYLPGCQQLQDPADNDSGAVRSELLFGERSIVPKFTVRMNANSDFYQALQKQTPLDWYIELLGPKIGAGFTVANPSAAPTLGTNTTGGALAAGTYYVVFTYENEWGETVKSAEQSQVVPSGTATNTVTVTAAALPTGATGIRVYVGTAAGVHKYAGKAASNSFTITALPTIGVAAPTVNRTTAVHKLSYRGHLVAYETVEADNRNGIVTLTVTPKILRDANGNTLTAVLLNETASYLT